MICGVDEAGRGPVLGPLVVGSVYAETDDALRKIEVKDSKKLTPKIREKMYDQIKDACPYSYVVIASAKEIDERRLKKSLNIIELEMFQEAVSKHPVETVYADCPDISEMGFSSALSVRLNGENVIARHKADDTFPIVSAASIIAKVTRDRMIEDIQKEFDMNIGSGYPSDHFTMEFIEKWIKDNGCPPKHTRCSWEPVKHLMSAARNTKLSDW
ncbi:MAG: ribonuclease HII [Candidatus Methanomethylophilaceae archaeon]|nr:ribonuclease HII [Candidatus Methanomethylophilaceae archaeon]MDY0224751.1 ribonuclease HII [Candidatus Methanomethylophilaceae archaeon]